jgi:hypothetical protein
MMIPAKSCAKAVPDFSLSPELTVDFTWGTSDESRQLPGNMHLSMSLDGSQSFSEHWAGTVTCNDDPAVDTYCWLNISFGCPDQISIQVAWRYLPGAPRCGAASDLTGRYDGDAINNNLSDDEYNLDNGLKLKVSWAT